MHPRPPSDLSGQSLPNAYWHAAMAPHFGHSAV